MFEELVSSQRTRCLKVEETQLMGSKKKIWMVRDMDGEAQQSYHSPYA